MIPGDLPGFGEKNGKLGVRQVRKARIDSVGHPKQRLIAIDLRARHWIPNLLGAAGNYRRETQRPGDRGQNRQPSK